MRRHKTMFLGLCLKMLGVLSPACALQTYPLVDHHSTSIAISQKGQNRIAVLGDRIQQVFGAEGFFDVQSDDEGGQIFLKPLESHPSKTSKPITLTIITESGLTQDLKLSPGPIDSQSILFKLDGPQKEKKQPHTSLDFPHIISLMKTMVREETLKGYTKSPLKELEQSFPVSLKVEPLFSYKGENYEGKVYTLTHQEHGPSKNEFLHLNEEDFSLKGDVAISLSKILLNPGEKATLYVVSKISPSSQTGSKNDSSGRIL